MSWGWGVGEKIKWWSGAGQKRQSKMQRPYPWGSGTCCSLSNGIQREPPLEREHQTHVLGKAIKAQKILLIESSVSEPVVIVLLVLFYLKPQAHNTTSITSRTLSRPSKREGST